MIAAQRATLEQARRSREDALKATKAGNDNAPILITTYFIIFQIKSNFLASMSHELRTPFRYAEHPQSLNRMNKALTDKRSSFYGLLDILSSTELNPGQREIGEQGYVDVDLSKC